MRAVVALLVPAMALALVSCSSQQPAETGPVTGAWVRLAPVPGNPSAAYFTLHGGKDANRLISVSSAKVATIQMHESRKENGMMQMAELDGVDIAPGKDVVFAPGGMHVMLFGVAPEIKAGDTMKMMFRFKVGDPVVVDARVESANGEEAHH
jgi:copper(I)-binding protein